MTTNNLDFKLLLDALTEAIAEKVSDKIKPTPTTQTQTSPDEEWLDSKQACGFIGIKSRVTLDRYVYEGRIDKPIQRGGRKLYYKKSSLINFLNNG